jgi:hypothetical protein
LRSHRLAIAFFAACAAASAASACAHTGQAAGDLAPATAIGLSVTNQNFLDMDVYAVSDGLATRLGTVNGNNSRIFTLNPSLAVRDLRIVATPIGGNGQASTGEVIVSPGQTIEFRIGSTLRNSTVSIRSP